AKCWLLSILLLLTIASSWPTGTSAAPRRARGLSLILPHRHHHHQHARSIDKVEIAALLVNQTEGREKCSRTMAMSDTNNGELRKNLTSALQVAIDTRDAVICLTKEWLENIQKDTLKSVVKRWSWHILYLQHPLQAEVKNVHYNDETEMFEYQSTKEAADVKEEIPAIIETLLVMVQLFDTVRFQHKSWHCYFNNFKDFFYHNVHEALRVVNRTDACNPGNSEYNEHHPKLEFGAALESIRVLTVIVHKYEELLQRLS
ncbi:hypothetical protein KR084_006085, partial [Drosophila pseudotakahashii]